MNTTRLTRPGSGVKGDLSYTKLDLLTPLIFQQSKQLLTVIQVVINRSADKIIIGAAGT